MKKLNCLLVLYILFVFGAYSVMAQKAKLEASIEQDECEMLSLHFLELKGRSWETSRLRHVEIFFDGNFYTESNLLKAFQYLSSKYRDLNTVSIVLYTNWGQLSDQNDCRRGTMSETSKAEVFDGRKAFYYRDSTKEYFRYLPSDEAKEFSLTVIRGQK